MERLKVYIAYILHEKVKLIKELHMYPQKEVAEVSSPLLKAQ